AAVGDDLSDTEQDRQANMQGQRNRRIANHMHLCAVSLRGGKDSLGIPGGLQITAGANQEERLLPLSLQCEEVKDTAARCLGPCPQWYKFGKHKIYFDAHPVQSLFSGDTKWFQKD